uniref:Uncharacterized protein n=1 Tax=Anguilla anguilla TaxID=7936 RepID=A0A0E9QS84_ANGAN
MLAITLQPTLLIPSYYISITLLIPNHYVSVPLLFPTIRRKSPLHDNTHSQPLHLNYMTSLIRNDYIPLKILIHNDYTCIPRLHPQPLHLHYTPLNNYISIT